MHAAYLNNQQTVAFMGGKRLQVIEEFSPL